MNEPWHLLEAYFEGELTPAEEHSLTTWLTSDPDHLRIFVQEAHLSHGLSREFRAGKSFTAILEKHTPAKKRNSPLVRFPSIPKKVRAPLALAASIMLVVTFSVWLFPRTNNEPTLLLPPGAQLTIQKPNGTTIAARDKAKLQPGDLLRLSGTNAITLAYAPEPTTVKLHPGTELKLTSRSSAKTFTLSLGKLEATVARQRPFSPMRIQTPQAEVRVLGTQLALTTTSNSTRLDVSEGKVRLTRTIDRTRIDVPANHYTIAATANELSSLPQTGQILFQRWMNASERRVTDFIENPRYPNNPDVTQYVTSFTLPLLYATNAGSRLIGYLHPPVTGDYTFWISAYPNALFFLSEDDSPANASQIFRGGFDARPGEWKERSNTENARMKSDPIPLIAGRRYYIEAVHKASQAGGHFAIGWTIPGKERELISGQFLSPYLRQTKEKR